MIYTMTHDYIYTALGFTCGILASIIYGCFKEAATQESKSTEKKE